jgi:hypothetical protein
MMNAFQHVVPFTVQLKKEVSERFEIALLASGTHPHVSHCSMY